MYATRDDMVTRFGEREVIALTDRDYAGQINDTVLTEALVNATAEIDGYLGGRYPLPMATPPKILTGYACDIARYRMCGADAVETELIRDRYKDAIRFLELVAAGRVTLGGMPGGGPAPVDNTVQFTPGLRVFARDGGAF